MESQMGKLGWRLVDFLFPPSCAGCGKWGSRYCTECLNRTVLIDDPFCSVCGEPLDSGSPAVCSRCFSEVPLYKEARAWAIFQPPLQDAIHKLKYRNDIGLADAFAVQLDPVLTKTGWKVDLVVPVPLDERRQKKRGYNQAALLARCLAARAGLTFNGKALMRTKDTRSQVGLTRGERRENVRDAFLGIAKIVDQLTVLLVDDVITTGATLNACSKALIEAGASEVYALTLARSVHLQ